MFTHSYTPIIGYNVHMIVNGNWYVPAKVKLCFGLKRGTDLSELVMLIIRRGTGAGRRTRPIAPETADLTLTEKGKDGAVGTLDTEGEESQSRPDDRSKCISASSRFAAGGSEVDVCIGVCNCVAQKSVVCLRRAVIPPGSSRGVASLIGLVGVLGESLQQL